MPFYLLACKARFRRQFSQVSRRSAVWLLLISLLAVGGLSAADETAANDNRGDSYYHFALGHLYHQFAQQYMRNEYVDRAVAEYTAALESDPGSLVIRIELINLYAGANRLPKAVALAEEILEEDPENLEVHRLLGSVYRSYATRNRQGVDAELLQKAIAQFEHVVAIDPDNVEHHVELGLLYRSAQKREEAEQSLQRALELDSGNVDAQVNLAYLLLEGRKFEEAIRVLEGIVLAGGTDRRFMNALADAYEQTGRFADAVEVYQKIVAQGGNTLQARQRLAENLFLSKQFTEALQQYRALIALDERNPTYYLRMSLIEGERGNFEEAWESLERARKLDPASLDVRWAGIGILEAEGKIREAAEQTRELLASTRKSEYSPNERRRRSALLERLGLLQRDLGLIEEASSTFQEIGELSPGAKPRMLAHVIEVWRHARQFARAEKEARKAVEEVGDDPLLINLLASVLADRGKTRDAIRVIERATKGADPLLEPLLAMARIYEKGRQFSKAEERIQEAAKLARSDEARVAVMFAYGSLYERSKRYVKSEASFRELLDLDPDNASALNYLGYMFADRNVHLDEAHDLIQKALDLEPDNGAYLDSLGWVYFRQDKLDLAVKYLERSLKQYEDDPVVHTHLGDVYFKQGRTVEAKRHWSRALLEWDRSAPADRDEEEVASLRRKLAELELSMAKDPGENKNDTAE